MGNVFAQHFPPEAVCPLCGGNHDKGCVLVVIDGTQTADHQQAKPVHGACLIQSMRFDPEKGLFYARALPVQQPLIEGVSPEPVRGGEPQGATIGEAVG
jgi:hypothetical protein